MDQRELAVLRQFLDTDRAEVVDARSMGGEVIRIPLRSTMNVQPALAALADNLSSFMEAVTGRGYQKTEEVYDLGYTVREPGHQAYGLKVTTEEGCAVVSRVAILEDESVFQRYVHYLRTGLVV